MLRIVMERTIEPGLYISRDPVYDLGGGDVLPVKAVHVPLDHVLSQSSRCLNEVVAVKRRKAA
jgi:hypothetical protein